jgi:HPt (histidine-containing phosphotransfer) domain-containing protein
MDRVLRVIASTLGRKMVSAPKSAAPQTTPRTTPRTTPPPKPVSAPKPPVADPIKTTLPDDPIMLGIVAEFVDRLNQQVGAMKKAADEHDLAQVAFLAHWLKGSGGTAGFDVFTGPARHLEQLAKAGELSHITDALAEIQALVERVERPNVPTAVAAVPVEIQK